MPIAFVHGVPETAAIWQPLVAALGARGADDVTLLSPPGFGAPLPDAFEATRTRYAHWLCDHLDALGGDVDLVGHDWGAGHVFGALDLHPELVRSWSTDCLGLLHPDYVWHDMAQVWQTPGAGEEAVAGMTSVEPADRAAGMQELGMPEGIARDLVEHQNEAMGRAILSLYRSAAQPAMRELGERVAAASLPPGMVLLPTADPYVGPVASAEERAAALGAPVCRLEDEGHWWMFGAAVETVADALLAHWADA